MKPYFEMEWNGLNKISNLLLLIFCLCSQCKNGGWICHEQPLVSRTCSVVGLTHLETFDGELLTVKPGNYLLVQVRKWKAY